MTAPDVAERAFDGAPLKAIREERGISDAEVCASAGIDADTLAMIESVRVGGAFSDDVSSYIDSIGLDLNEGFRLAGFMRSIGGAAAA